jgi:hypothetical protein
MEIAMVSLFLRIICKPYTKKGEYNGSNKIQKEY